MLKVQEGSVQRGQRKALLSAAGSQCYQPTNKCHNTSCEKEAGYNTSCAIITLAVSPAALSSVSCDIAALNSGR